MCGQCSVETHTRRFAVSNLKANSMPVTRLTHLISFCRVVRQQQSATTVSRQQLFSGGAWRSRRVSRRQRCISVKRQCTHLSYFGECFRGPWADLMLKKQFGQLIKRRRRDHQNRITNKLLYQYLLLLLNTFASLFNKYIFKSLLVKKLTKVNLKLY